MYSYFPMTGFKATVCASTKTTDTTVFNGDKHMQNYVMQNFFQYYLRALLRIS